jgi:hypothetical protein
LVWDWAWETERRSDADSALESDLRLVSQLDETTVWVWAWVSVAPSDETWALAKAALLEMASGAALVEQWVQKSELKLALVMVSMLAAVSGEV